MRIAGCTVAGPIHESATKIVYRAVDETSSRPVVLKVLLGAYPSPGELARLTREYVLTHELDVEGVTRSHRLERYENGLVLVQEDGGEALRDRMRAGPLDLADAVRAVARIAQVLDTLHRQGIVHRDVNPNNILLGDSTGSVRLTDFGVAIATPPGGVPASDVVVGTVAYLAPEQTGRTNHPVDGRSDLYSLGATLYEVAAGSPPFGLAVAQEILHGHLAIVPTPPHLRRPGVPDHVSAVVMKLLSKDPDARYQTGAGLAEDLDECLERIQGRHARTTFVAGVRDRGERLVVPDRIYGRQVELDAIRRAGERVRTGGFSMLALVGEPGAGKTVCARAAAERMVAEHGILAAGKYDSGASEPLAGFIQAFRSVARQVMTGLHGSVESWGRRIEGALAPNTRLVIDLAPEWGRILGSHEALRELPPDQNEMRLYTTLEAFLRALPAPEQPVVLLMDDLQWADPVSVRLIEHCVARGGAPGMLLMGTWRDGEAPGVQDLFPSQIILRPLGDTPLSELVHDALSLPAEQEAALVQRLRERTAGNPLFARTMLYELHRRGLLRRSGGGWTWDDRDMATVALGDNVALAIAERVGALSSSSRALLGAAAALGSTVSTHLLSVATGVGEAEIEPSLRDAIAAGVVAVEAQGVGESVPEATIRFAHDRVRQAAYETLGPGAASRVHLEIGRRLWAGLTERERADRVLQIAEQANRAIELVTDPVERAVFAQVNALAARRARETASYDAGAGYAERGLAFLGSDAWNTHHAIALSLYEEGAEAAYARREFARCETMISEATGHARTDIEAVRVTDIQLRSLMAQQRLGEAVRAGGALLRRLGISVPQKPNMGHIAWQLIRTLLTLRGRGALKLSRLADMNDPRALAALQIAMTLTAITFFAAPDLLPVIGLQVVRLSARRGNSPLSAFSYTIYGMVLGLLGNTRGAYDFGRLGMEVLERYGARETRAKIHTAYYALIHHRRHPLRDCLEPLMAAYRHGMADGDTEFAALALVNHVGYQLFSGVALEEVDRTARWACSVVRDLSQLRHLTDLRITHQCTLNLMGRATDPRLLEGEAFSESAEAARLDNAQDRESLLALWALRGMARYVLGDPAGALERAEDVEAHLWKRGEIGAYPVEHFLYALFYLAAARDRPERRARYVRLSQRHQKAIQVWGRDAPMNHRHKWDLIEAERLSVLGRDVEPLTLYEAAIAGARENGYLQEEAIALELASRHHRDRGRPGVASAYLRDAHHAYVRWGATAKVRQLEQGHPALLSVPQPASGGQVTVTGRTVQVADLGLILEALQTIAGEILIDHLLDRLMRILLQGAGADEGYLLLDEDGELVLKALGSVRGGVVSVSLISRSMSADDPPSALVRYVARTGVPLVVSDVNTDELFHADTCLRGGGVRSVLCVPVAHRGIRKGIICLTNSLVAGAFRQDRAELIGLLASQAAVSLENAGLYARLLEDIEARKRVERELRESEETARGLLNALGEPAFLVDGRGRLFERNAAFAGRFAPPPTGPKGTAWSVMGPIGAVAAELVADAMRTGQARRRETPVGSRWTDVVAYPVTHLEIPKSAVVLFDVTERKETQRQLEIEREELQRADKLATIGVLVTSVAHEVTSPNQAVRLAGDVLARVLPDLLRAVDEYVQDDSLLVGGLALPELRRRCADALSAVHDGSAHIAAIVAELTAYGARERELPTDRADINEAVLAAARLLDTHIRQFTDRFRLDLADELPMVDGNTSKVEQVVVNLIENACHALTGRGAAIVVSTRYDSPTGEVRIIVQDEGRGIEPDLIARITDPFFTTRRDAGGTGLGLSISERIVARYGGSLRFESVVGRGTAATAAIPVPRPR